MFLSTLLLAAALQAPPAVAAPSPAGPPAPAAVPFVQTPRMKGQRSPFECRQRATLARKAEDGSTKPLNRMPMALGERAVMRMVDGCPVRAPLIQGR
ncbi:hypothetical protein [Caulobacter segnis]|uniref:hypothetical protein n=1 Tax=Caulobacter segnis TaxID=88688 RepID=UPI002861EBCC|nr:hypothetical protein [Caulobacter segnis]MDR6624604.1 hypothetical protein [Caulobacter segnis]